ncbi:MAG: hypothetical protein A3I61_11960 [Acidobacteria bacterium RIFCSPLOWO2_02_FULL_68_18]|nr:MAG: hypothetical protein A3I61_11960 [Acidobacteria bacterium RIFCSPLOWO2_02_FULL_68_18]OFW49667.1 MAG: hypothetical protein A3G77_16525 [Acidobacteria bacterium RIFCSPLOWO2_12_FULL_68_19]
MADMPTPYAPPAEIEGPRSRALLVGLVGLAACVAGFIVDRDHFFRSWLVAYLLFLGIALGSMGLLMIQHLSGGAWGVFRRVFEASSRTLPLMALLFLPVVLGMGTLYPWTHPDQVAQDEVLRHRAIYLNTGFFLARAFVYFAGWILIAWTLTRWSRRQDAGDMRVNLPIQYLAGGGLVFYTFAATFAAVDWIMSINPHWYSTLFGFIFVGGHGISALSFTIVVSTLLARWAPMDTVLKPSHFHDLGKLSLAFVMLWAYFNFSQYMLVYAANLVEEIPYFIARTSGGWQYLALFLVVFQFAVPFLLLLSRDLKRMPLRLVWVSAALLLVRDIDLFMLVAPEFDAASGANLHVLTGEHASHVFVHWLDLAAPLAIGGLWVWMFFTQLAQRPLLAFADPYLRNALESPGGH